MNWVTWRNGWRPAWVSSGPEAGDGTRMARMPGRRGTAQPCYHSALSIAQPISASAFMSTDKTNQSWGGRFSEPVDAFVARFTASVEFDKRLYRHDIMGSIAHATMLEKAGVLSSDERDQIIANLKDIQAEIEAGTFDWRVDLEDVHMNIEARLTDRIG